MNKIERVYFESEGNLHEILNTQSVSGKEFEKLMELKELMNDKNN